MTRSVDFLPFSEIRPFTHVDIWRLVLINMMRAQRGTDILESKTSINVLTFRVPCVSPVPISLEGVVFACGEGEVI